MEIGAFDLELYALGYRSNRVEIEGLTIKDKPLPKLSKYSLLELIKKHNIVPSKRYLVCDRDGTIIVSDFIPNRTEDGWEIWGFRYYIKLKKPSYDWDRVIISLNGFIQDTSLTYKGKIFGFYRNDHPEFITDTSIYLKENYYVIN